MADQELTDLTETTTPVSTDMAYLVIDPGGVPLDRKVEVGTLLGNLGAWVNLAMNSPGQIYGAGLDGATPQWWADGANATTTDEDTAGEGIPDRTERVFKVVTTDDDSYGYQTLTFANESLLDAGQTVVSFSCWVYCASASVASIGIYGTNLGLQESSQHTGGASWELLTVENQTLDAADTSIQLRLICDTGTAYFTQPMLNPGSCSMPWLERGQKFVPVAVNQLDLNTTGDVAWSDTDCTANTHPLATAMQIRMRIYEADGTVNSYFDVAHNDTIVGSDALICTAREYVIATNIYASTDYVMCDDSQVIRYRVEEVDADNDVRATLTLTGYWRWAP